MRRKEKEKHCQNSSRNWSRNSELVCETIISFSQNYPVPSGMTKCYCSVYDTRQIAFTSTQMALFAQWKHVLSLTHKILISNQIKYHLIWWTSRLVHSGCSSQASSGNAHPLYRCKCLGLGCSFRTGGTGVGQMTNPNSISMSSKLWLFLWLWKEHIM